MSAVVAAAWAMIAGCVRTVGQVTAVPTSTRSVTWAIPPSTDHTNGLWPCWRVHGWKWSEMVSSWKPTCSARRAHCSIGAGRCSSLDRW